MCASRHSLEEVQQLLRYPVGSHCIISALNKRGHPSAAVPQLCCHHCPEEARNEGLTGSSFLRCFVASARKQSIAHFRPCPLRRMHPTQVARLCAIVPERALVIHVLNRADTHHTGHWTRAGPCIHRSSTCQQCESNRLSSFFAAYFSGCTEDVTIVSTLAPDMTMQSRKALAHR